MSLVADGVTVRIGGKVLLQDASLTVAPGEVVAIVGPNGAGKSTLMRVLAGDVRPNAGTVLLSERSLAAWSLVDLARQRAVMGSDTPVAFPFTVAEVVALGCGPIIGDRMSPQVRNLVGRLLDDVDCATLAERTYSTLSSGERQRVRLARALAQITSDEPADRRDHRYLLLDEPTSSLDLAHQHAAMRLVRRKVIDEDVAVVAVLHDLNLAASYADRVTLLNEGRVVAQGAPDSVLRADILTTVFRIPMLVLRQPGLRRPLLVADP
jgi:iron complex transport system ATP-binding protein